MKIRTRLSITFSIISSAIFIGFGITIYVLSSKYRGQDFQERLKGRVEITEKIFLEKESFSPAELEKITNQFLHTLPEETEEVIELLPHQDPTFKHEYPKEIKDGLINNNIFEFEYGKTQGMGRKFHVKNKDYLIIVTAIDQVGFQNISFLKNIIIFLILIGIPLIFGGSFFITKRALLPISRKIIKANEIGASNLDQRLNVINPNDELGKMTIAFNKLLDRLEASFEAQKSFIRNASHEIRNPLTAIMGEAEVAASKSRTNEEYLSSLNTIIAEAEVLNSTVNNLLQLSKISANEFNLQFENIQLDIFLAEIKKSYDFINANNEIVIECDNNLFIAGNKNLLKTAILNLFDNACKFSSNKLVNVILTKEKEWLKLVIKDKGIGIPDQDIENVKTPFYRSNNALKLKGTGIGLSLSSKIIELHKGILTVNSQIGVGTEIHIKLPVISA